MTSWLPADARIRGLVLSLGGTALLFVLVAFVMPGEASGRGTPNAIVFASIVRGLLNALTAVGLVLVYRSMRVINFAQTALGVAGAELTFQLLALTSTPWWLAVPAGVIVAGLAGLLFDLAIGRRFFRSPRLVLTVATVATASFLAALARQGINALPFFPAQSERTFAELSGSVQLGQFLPFNDLTFTIGGLPIPFGFPHLFAIGVSVLALVGTALYFRLAPSGVAVRAMAENTERASLLGISTQRLSSIVWVLAAVLSGVGIIATGMLTSPASVGGTAPAVLIPALAAAVLARFTSVPVAVGAAIGIQVLRGAFEWSFSGHEGLIDLLLFAVIALGLLAQRRQLGRSEESGGVSWEASAEQRQIPSELRAIPGVKWSRRAFLVAIVLTVAVYPWVVGVSSRILGSVIAVNGILALSMLVLTGWAGQVSLGQYGFAAIGGVVAGALTSSLGLSFWIAVPLATLLTAAIAAAIGVPALRIRGLFLAVATLAFATAVHAVLFNDRYFDWLLPSSIDRPTLFLLDFSDDRSMYYLSVLSLGLAVVVVANLRRSRSGRVLIAVRENEANLQTFAVSAFRAKLVAFAVSGALAGFAGSLLVHVLRTATEGSFGPERSIDLFMLAVIGGISSIPGVVLGAVVFNVQTFFLSGNVVFGAIQPFVAILLLVFEPAGLIAVFNRVRDAVLRIVAQRRQLIVPSLFADVDPAALHARLVPLAAPTAAAGLGALPAETRYVQPTDLYAGSDAGRLFGRDRSRRHNEELAALESAAERAAETVGARSGGEA